MEEIVEGIDLCLDGPTFSTIGWGRFGYESRLSNHKEKLNNTGLSFFTWRRRLQDHREAWMF